MSRTLSSALEAAVYSRESSKVALFLLEITHADLPAPIRVVCNHTAITSGGNVYSPYYFEIQLPDDTEEVISGTVKLVIDNTDRAIVEAIRSIDTPATVNLYLVAADTPDTVEISLTGMKLRNVSYDFANVSGDLVYEERLSNQIPQHRCTPNLVPGIY